MEKNINAKASSQLHINENFNINELVQTIYKAIINEYGADYFTTKVNRFYKSDYKAKQYKTISSKYNPLAPFIIEDYDCEYIIKAIANNSDIKGTYNIINANYGASRFTVIIKHNRTNAKAVCKFERLDNNGDYTFHGINQNKQEFNAYNNLIEKFVKDGYSELKDYIAKAYRYYERKGCLVCEYVDGIKQANTVGGYTSQVQLLSNYIHDLHNGNLGIKNNHICCVNYGLIVNN